MQQNGGFGNNKVQQVSDISTLIKDQASFQFYIEKLLENIDLNQLKQYYQNILIQYKQVKELNDDLQKQAKFQKNNEKEIKEIKNSYKSLKQLLQLEYLQYNIKQKQNEIDQLYDQVKKQKFGDFNFDDTDRPNESTLQNIRKLAKIFATGTDVCFVTGAGLSVSSGITPYRYSTSAIWSNFILTQGTRKSFLANPSSWWNDFWLRTHEKKEFLNAIPNPGHYAIANITKLCQNVRVVTQNIDNLHQKAGVCQDIIAPVHGSLGLYKCVNVVIPGSKVYGETDNPPFDKEKYPEIKKDYRNNAFCCPYAQTKIIHIDDINKYRINNTSLEQGNLRVNVPRCPGCFAPIMPLTLLFDEKYQSHDGFKWNRAEQWFQRAKSFVFVGTSFAVTVTSEALERANKNQASCFNFNIQYDAKVAADHKNIQWIIGKAEKLLPLLYEMIVEEIKINNNNQLRMCLYSKSDK